MNYCTCNAKNPVSTSSDLHFKTMDTNVPHPQIIIILSGKRKSGKDYIAERIINRLGPDRTVIIRLSGPLKCQYAKENNLNYEQLLEASSYKELYREDMITWGEKKRTVDPGYFCRLAIEQSNAFTKNAWIVSDARRTTDIIFFKENFKNVIRTVRVEAKGDVRISRGWKFTQGVDDVESECGLDNYSEWDCVISNDGNNEELEMFISKLVQL